MATTINTTAILRKVAYSKPVLDATKKVAMKITETATVNAELEFAQNPITQEIEDGPFTSNTSGLLGGYGNLFSFIGFPIGSDPVTAIKQKWASVRFGGLRDVKLSNNKAKYIYRVSIPSPDDFESISPLPWASGRSWLKSISTGLSNLGYYLQFRGKGRSGGGVQQDRKIRSANMKTDPYFTRIYNIFSKTFNPWIKF